jgi:RHS repeat-associated protein
MLSYKLKHNSAVHTPEDFEPELKVINNLYAFGSNQPNRSFFDADGSGTFGFNGMLKDNEIKGEGNSYDFGARIYDPRIGRFLSTDPATKLYPYYSPYQFAGNKPIDHIDYNGEHEWKITYIHNSSGDIVQTKLQLVKYGNFSPLNPHWYNSYHYIINSDGSVSRYNIGSGGPNSNSTHRPNAPSNILARTDNALPHINTKTWEWKDNGLFPTKFKNISKHVWGVSNDPISVQPRIPYSMSTFNSSSSFQQQIMTQPSQAAIDEIGVLASQYKAGIIANISIEIRTNLGQDSQGIQKSNNLRQSALVDALIDSGVKREDITILPQKYNQTTWDAEINYKRVLKPDIEE